MIATAKRCEKVRYTTKGAANQALDRIDAERPRQPGRKPIRAYWCLACSVYHLTSQAKR